ncbi:MAG: hypothetical protein KAJ12_12070 [Bacteroidetes bacterium]|nr:hypothetical protein [Bacteroidota bacterium]
MKTLAVVLAGGLLVAGATAHAGGKAEHAAARPYFSDSASHARADMARAVGKYKPCLECGHSGVIESALAHLAWMKIMRPEADLSAMRESLDQLSVAGATPAIRYKAYLTFLVVDDPSMFAEIRNGMYNGSDELFAAISKTLRKNLLGYNDRKYVREQ